MAVKLKLTRMGSKKHPFYRVVAANDETRRDGRPLAYLGYYNPMVDPAEVKLDADKVKEWLARGAQPTDTVRALLKAYMGSFGFGLRSGHRSVLFSRGAARVVLREKSIFSLMS